MNRRPKDPRGDLDRDMREALLSRYGGIGRHGPMLRARMLIKQFAWRAVVGTTRLVKRIFDIAVAVTALVLLLPLLLVVAALVKLDSPGPLLFNQQRVGRHGRTFRMWKFRSMYVDAEKRKQQLMARNEMQGGVIFKMKDDPRVTRVGRVIRKLSIDELPQLWNVLVGDMSIVGPRPLVPSEVAEYTIDERRRLDVVPGITCIWQVSGRSDIPFDQQVRLDVQYIESQSLWLDFVILLKTVPAVLLGKGAY
jgi:exopolysaccharide biosynthesis polyprenyl glycosylphosphotransferase